MRLRFVCSFAPFALFVACGGATSSPSSTVTIAQACADRAKASCQRLASCDGTYVLQEFGSEADCESAYSADCEVRLAAPGNGNNASVTEACALATPGWGCGAATPAACEQATGPLAVGSPCVAAGQCQSGFCAISTSSCGACAPPPEVGDPCTLSAQCAGGLACTSADTCVTPAGAGSACSDTQPCGDGLRCQGTPSTCATLDSTVDSGQMCGVIDGKNVACNDGVCENSRCVAHAKAGEACDFSGGPYCAYATHCVAGTCVKPACM